MKGERCDRNNCPLSSELFGIGYPPSKLKSHCDTTSPFFVVKGHTICWFYRDSKVCQNTRTRSSRPLYHFSYLATKENIR